MKKYVLLVLLLSLVNMLRSQSPPFNYLPHAHSHNDYLKKKPLWGALENGCSSIEIDVFAHKGELKVAHVGFALNIRKTFDEMYLLPLVDYLKENSSIFENGEELVLMVDFKTNRQITLPLLLKNINNYKEHFSFYSKGEVHQSALKLVISGGGFSYDQVSSLDSIYVFLDGSVSSCTTEMPIHLVPRGSARYGSQFSWKGKGEMPQEELLQLKNYILEAKMCNKKLRFYAMPENEAIWELFINEGVYWINIDDSKKFKEFFTTNYQEE